MANINGLSAYQQTSQLWNQANKKTSETDKKTEVNQSQKSSQTSQTQSNNNIKTSEWKPIDMSSSLIPTKRDGIGMAIGNIELSDKAKDYYSQLKSKFGNMEFIAVSKDMKSRVQANAAAYGNANKMVVLIDEEKLERMATDESFRKKYEGIIAMSQNKLAEAKNSLASSGASIKNFGMNVNSDGSTSFFATLEASGKDQAKRIEKKQAEKKAAKIKEEKKAQKKAQEKRLEKAKEEKKIREERLKPDKEDENTIEKKDYVKIEADSMEDLMNKVSKYAYNESANSVLTESEQNIGQSIDFRG